MLFRAAYLRTMLRLRTRVLELSPAVMEYISCRHSGLLQRLSCLGHYDRCESTSVMSAASPVAADTEYNPIKKLLVANRGKLFSIFLVAVDQCDLLYWQCSRE